MKTKKFISRESRKKLAKGKTSNYQDLLNARKEVGSKIVFINPKISQVKTKIKE